MPRFAFEPLILASRSPRRRELLEKAGYEFDVVPASDDAEDLILDHERPAEAVARLAYQKARDVVRRVERGTIIACDTVAERAGRVLGKPLDEADARRMLHTLRGTTHRVLSGLCVWRVPDGDHQTVVETTTLFMEPLDDDAIEAYLASGQWQGKAGAFGYQDELGWIGILEGSASNVVGLPMERLQTLLRRG